jgi:hypothetical protein
LRERLCKGIACDFPIAGEGHEGLPQLGCNRPVGALEPFLGLAPTTPAADSTAKPYRILATTQIPAAGGIDYVTADSVNRRVYVACGNAVSVFDLDTYKLAGTLPDASGHGVAIDPENHTGLVSGNTATFFDGPTANNDWVGLDMTGQLPKMITSVRFFPRASFAGRMLNGIFQGSNTNDFSTNVVLGTISSTPPAGVYTTMTFAATNAFSYVRYLSPTNGSGNVAELEFYGIDLANSNAPATSTNLTASGGDRQVSLTWASISNAASYKIKRGATNAVGPFSVIASGLIGTNYTDTNVVNGTVYYYRVDCASEQPRGSFVTKR